MNAADSGVTFAIGHRGEPFPAGACGSASTAAQLGRDPKE